MIICLVILIPYVYMSSLVTDLQIDTCIFSNNAYPIHIFDCFLCYFQQLYACCIYNYFLFLTVIMPVLLADMICLRDKAEFLNPDSYFSVIRSHETKMSQQKPEAIFTVFLWVFCCCFCCCFFLHQRVIKQLRSKTIGP